MVEIISKRDGPRREDVEAHRLIEQNRGAIGRIADHLTGGGYSTRRSTGKPAQETSRQTIHILGGRPSDGEAHPYIRVSPNGRVVMVDQGTGRQMFLLGEIRRSGSTRRFVLATKENGFFAPLDPDLVQAIRELDQIPIAGTYTEGHLSAEIGMRLGIE